MTGWTEETLRTAASWKAFKEGKSLLASGAVAEAKAGQSAWRGAVRAGKRMIRVSVTVKSATDFETRCSCPENQATGELCAHAVAVGLAALAGGATAAETPAKPAASAKMAEVVAREILFPPNWREALSRGRLAVTATVSRDAEVSPADHRLADWLAKAGVAEKATLNLHLDGDQAAAFLETISGHPMLVSGKDRSAIQISTGHRLRLGDASRTNGAVRLVPDADATWVEIGGSFWQIAGESIERAGEGAVPMSLAGPMRELTRKKPAEVPLPELLANLDAWQDWLGFPTDGWLDSLHFIPAPMAVSLALEGSLQHLEGRLSVSYAGASPVPPGLGKVPGLPRMVGDHCEVRNLSAEEQVVRRLEGVGFQLADISSGSWVLRGEDAVLGFLSRTLPDLRDIWEVREGPRFGQATKQVAVISPQIEILGSGEDWLGFDLKFQTTDGGEVPAAEIRQLLRTGGGVKKGSGGRRLILSDEMANIIEPLFSELDLRQRDGHFEANSRAGEVILEVRKKLHKRQDKNEKEKIKPFALPPTVQAKLRPYQEQGAAWLFDRAERFGGALLADDMGLGKTLQTIAWIERVFSGDPVDSGVVLVVVTASLLGNWRAEFERFAPGRRVRILHGTGRDQEREKVSNGEVVITSYGTLARDLAWHLKREYRAVVVDEASLMRNPDTDHAKAVAKLRSDRRIALTGTPVENSVRDLWSVFRFVQPGWLGNREEFRERYELPLTSGVAAGAVMERLRLKTGPFLLRRTKEQVAPELPAKLIIDEFCDLTSDQQAVYRELLVEGRKQVDAIADSGNQGAARMQMLTALLRLRQTCCDLALFESDRFKQMLVARRSAKLQRLLELLDEANAGGHRVLVFSQFQKQLREIEKCVSERGWDSLRLDGQTRNRQQLVDKFQDPKGPPVFLISLKAGGYGLNLTAADTVIHFDPWWNPAAEAQATDRAHRIGQTRPVTVYRLLTRGTVEEKVVRLQAKKRELAAAIDESGAGEAVGWSMDDLKSVFS